MDQALKLVETDANYELLESEFNCIVIYPVGMEKIILPNFLM